MASNPLFDIGCAAVGLVAHTCKPVLSAAKGCLASLGLFTIGMGHLLLYGSDGVDKFVDETKNNLRQKLPTEKEENEMREAYVKKQEERQKEEHAYKIRISQTGAGLALRDMSTDIQESIQRSTSLALQDFHQNFSKDLQKIVKTELKNAFQEQQSQIEQLLIENEKQRFQLQLILNKKTKQPQLENKKQFVLTTSEYKINHK